MTTSPWISVKDRLPEGGNTVIALLEGVVPLTLRYLGDSWYSAGLRVKERVTHWMPLPDPPKPEDSFEEWWDSTGKWIGCGSSHDYARKIWDAAIASQKTDKQQP